MPKPSSPSNARLRAPAPAAFLALLAFLPLGAIPAAAAPFAELPYVPPPPLPDDRADIPPPAERPVNVWEDAWERQFTEQFRETFDLARHVRRLAGRPKEAQNVDAFDEVGASSWFVPRSGASRLPDTAAVCPDTSGDWTVFKAKMTGKAPGLFIADARGKRFILKFDPPGWPELSTGAEVVNARFLHAAGYHVPANCIVHFRRERVRVGGKVGLTDARGRKRNMTPEDVRSLFAQVDTLPDGSIRAAASGFIPGKGLGPFRYRGTRPDDPNDIVPHEHRREIRALRVLYAWLKRFDINSGNTYDSYVEEGGARYVRHYLLDFGGDLGASMYGATPPARGHENVFDPHQIGINILTLGLLVPPWERQDTAVAFAAVGRYDARLFHPAKFKFLVPAKAFEQLTDRDGYWGAKRVLAFDSALVRDLVRQGRYSDPRAVEHFVSAILERRALTLDWWFRRVASLDSVRVEGTAPGVLRFADLLAAAGLDGGKSAYAFTIRGGDADGAARAPRSPLAAGAGIPLPEVAAVASRGSRGVPALAVDIEVRRGPSPRFADAPRGTRTLRVHLEGDTLAGTWSPIGLERN